MRVDLAGGRSGDTGLGPAQARRRPPLQLPAGERHRRCCPRPLLDPGHQARPGLALPRRRGRDQPARALRPRRVRALRRAGAGQPAPAHRREPDRAARRPAADGGRPVRPHDLRHGPADRAPAGRQSGPPGPAGRGVPAPDRGGAVRPYRGPDHRRHAGLAEPGGVRAAGLCARPASGWPTRSPSSTAASATSRCGWRARRREPMANVTREQYHAMVERAKEYIRAGDIFQVVPSQRFELRVPPAAVRALPRAASAQSLAVPVLPRPRRATRWWARAPRSWCACATARSRCARSPGTRRRGADKAEDEALAAGSDGRSQGAGRAPDAARPRPQRCRPRGPDRHGAGHREDEGRVLLPRHAHRLERRGRRSGPTATRSTR